MPLKTHTLLHGVFALILSWPSSGQEFSQQTLEFESDGAVLSGTLVLPPTEDVRAAVVFVHGSGPQRRNLALARRFAEDGIAALVYDKRGVGESGGDYENRQSVSEKNLRRLAADAAAALAALRQQDHISALPLGLTGISQAGWIVPLAAEMGPAPDFMVIWSGPVCKVSEEDIYSKYTADRDNKRLPSFSEALAARRQPYVWPDFLGKDSDPSENLARMEIPALWIFGARDGSVPVDLSISRLRDLIDQGKPYEYILYSALGHNNMPESFAAATDWIFRTLAAPGGR